MWDDDRDDLAAPTKTKRVVLCTGKVYYDLLQARRDRGIDDIAILRLEQIYPFPANALEKELKPYKNADIIWCQEEPQNQGAWFFVNPLIEELLAALKHKAARPQYAGRPASASPATGFYARHVEQQTALVEAALGV